MSEIALRIVLQLWKNVRVSCTAVTVHQQHTLICCVGIARMHQHAVHSCEGNFVQKNEKSPACVSCVGRATVPGVKERFAYSHHTTATSVYAAGAYEVIALRQMCLCAQICGDQITENCFRFAKGPVFNVLTQW